MRELWALFVILAIAILAGVAGRHPVPLRSVGENGPYQGQPGGSDYQKPHPDHDFPGSFVVPNTNLSASENTASPSQDEGAKRQDDPKWTDRAQAYSAIAIAALTFALIGINIYQSRHISRATKAAEKSAAAALTALPRGSLFCDLADTNLMAWTSGQASVIKMEIRFTNFGSAPAIIDSVVTKMEISDDLPDWKKARIDKFLTDNVIGVDRHKDHPMVQGVVNGNNRFFGTNPDTVFGLSEDLIRLYIMAKVSYRDIYQRSFETSYCVSYRTGDGMLRPEGDEEYNYQT
jgi:hypothetical protein